MEIYRKYPAPSAFHRDFAFELADLQGAADDLPFSYPKDDLLYLFATRRELPTLLQKDQSIGWSARILRNKLGHELGPGNVRRIVKCAPVFEPRFLAFLDCHEQILAHLKANYSHVM